MKLVFLDAKTIGSDIDLHSFSSLGEVIQYDYSTAEEALLRTKDADIIIVNKTVINETTIGLADHLKLVCVTATGTNNLDKEYLSSRKIAWRNVSGYSTESVAQHTFAMLFYLLEKLRYYDDYVKSGRYVNDRTFTHFDEHFHEISGMRFGIIGLGNIGRRVAEIATCFGADVIYYSASGAPCQPGYHQVDLDTLLTTSDVISIHAPLTEQTEGLLNMEAFRKMKRSCILLNLGRGPIVSESDLAMALKEGQIAAAGLDVLTTEPMAADNPLLPIKDSRRLFITPHIAWAAVESRKRLMEIIYHQIQDFLRSDL